MGATFHYEGGLQAKIPEAAELACLAAWREAWTWLPADVESHGAFAVAGAADAIVRDFDRQAVYGAFERTDEDRGWVLVVGAGEPGLILRAGWTTVDVRSSDGVRLISVARSRPARSRTSS
jgi:hypothetical protein